MSHLIHPFVRDQTRLKLRGAKHHTVADGCDPRHVTRKAGRGSHSLGNGTWRTIRSGENREDRTERVAATTPQSGPVRMRSNAVGDIAAAESGCSGPTHAEAAHLAVEPRRWKEPGLPCSNWLPFAASPLRQVPTQQLACMAAVQALVCWLKPSGKITVAASIRVRNLCMTIVNLSQARGQDKPATSSPPPIEHVAVIHSGIYL